MAGIPVLGLLAYGASEKKAYNKNQSVRSIKELWLKDLQAPQKIQSRAGQGDVIRIGFIGFGNRANQLARSLGFMDTATAQSQKENERLQHWMEQEYLNVKIVEICDVLDLHAENGLDIAKNGFRVNGQTGTDVPVKRYRPYQEMLADDSFDAVVVATPDHHHARIAADAVRAGKHVYCEKSISLSVEELNEIYNAVKNSDRVFHLVIRSRRILFFNRQKRLSEKISSEKLH